MTILWIIAAALIAVPLWMAWCDAVDQPNWSPWHGPTGPLMRKRVADGWETREMTVEERRHWLSDIRA